MNHLYITDLPKGRSVFIKTDFKRIISKTVSDKLSKDIQFKLAFHFNAILPGEEIVSL